MADKTAIEWTESTWTPLITDPETRASSGRFFCERVSPGCAHCYSSRMNATRFQGVEFPAAGDRKALARPPMTLDERILLQPLSWKRPRKIFVCSMTDVFGDWVADEWIDRMFAVMALTPGHTYQILTKRPERMLEYFEALGKPLTREEYVDCALEEMGYERLACAVGWPLSNVWVGTSTENQLWLDLRVQEILQVPAVVHFVSMEPMLGPMTFWHDTEVGPVSYLHGYDFGDGITDRLSWVIVGGESGGPEARRLIERCDHRRVTPAVNGVCCWCSNQSWAPKPEALAWVRSIRDECVAAGVPFLFKQWGGHTPKSGGRELDGRTWDEYPATAQ